MRWVGRPKKRGMNFRISDCNQGEHTTDNDSYCVGGEKCSFLVLLIAIYPKLAIFFLVAIIFGFIPDFSFMEIYLSYASHNTTLRETLTEHQKLPNPTYPKPPHAPRILLASWTSFCMMVTRFAWMAQRFVSANKCTMKASQLSCSA